jgi:uncharacterized repeat protein (TIGR01451 family)
MRLIHLTRKGLVPCLTASAVLMTTACTTDDAESTTARNDAQTREPVDTTAAMEAQRRELDAAIADAQRAAADAERAAREARAARMTGGSGSYFSPEVGPGMDLQMMAIPTGDPATSAVMLQVVMPSEIQKGEAFDMQCHVTNLAQTELQGVSLTTDHLDNLRVQSASPSAVTTENGYLWNLGTLPVGATESITVRGRAAETGMTSNCVAVSYNNTLCLGARVVEPGLELTKIATASALKCDPVILTYTVSNPGSGLARDVVIEDQLPSGLTTMSGAQRVRIPVGDLAAGESKRYEVSAQAEITGEFESMATAMAAGGLSVDSPSTMTIIGAPVLTVEAVVPDDRFLGRPFDLRFKVRNDGDAVALNTILTADVPAGTQVASIANAGNMSNNAIEWQLGNMAPNEEVTVSYRVNAAQPQTVRSLGRVTAYCAEDVTDAEMTKVLGIPAILLEVVDITDPVEVGGTSTYVITATNQGSAVGTNIAIECILPAEMMLVSSSGATRGVSDGSSLTFAPLARLEPGREAEWRVEIRATEAGDVRFEVQMTSDQLTRPVAENEATYLYR